MNSKRTTAALTLLFLLPWGIQFLVGNFLSIYVASLPFASEQTIGMVISLGSVVTMISQFLWTRQADRAKNKSTVLALSLVLLAACSALFLILEVHSEWLLLILVVLFYSCYMTHQPLIDTIASETYSATNHAFGWFRSFASLGYGCMGIFFLILPHKTPNTFFLYVVFLALISAVISKQIHSTQRPLLPADQAAQHSSTKSIFTAQFIKFLIYSFLLFVASTILGYFFPVYFSTDKGINHDVGYFSFIISAGTFLEWGLMILFEKRLTSLSPKLVFALIPLAGIFRSGIIYATENPYIMSFSVVFSGVWFSILWSSSTPYIKKYFRKTV